MQTDSRDVAQGSYPISASALASGIKRFLSYLRDMLSRIAEIARARQVIAKRSPEAFGSKRLYASGSSKKL